MSELLIASEVAARLRVTESCLYNWRKQGVGPRAFNLQGRVVWDSAELEAWIEAQKAKQ